MSLSLTPYLVATTPSPGGPLTVWNFQTLPQPGVTTEYRLVVSLNPDPAQGTTFLASAVNGQTFAAVNVGLTNTQPTFYVFSRAATSAGLFYSAPFVYVPNPGPPVPAAPSGPSTVPALVGVTNDSITVDFTVAGVTSTLPLVIACNASTSPSMTNLITCDLVLVGAGVYRATATGLTETTTYYFQTTVSNGVLPNQASAVSAGFATGPVPPPPPPPAELIPPSVPYLVAVTAGALTINFQTFPVPSLPATFAVVYNTVNNPTAPGSGANSAFNVSGEIWGSGPFGNFNTGTNWYIFASASAEGKTVYSGGFRYNSSDTGPPSGPTSTPVSLSTTNSTITVVFDTLGITGDLPLEPVCNASLSATGPFDIACNLVLVSPDNYQATADQLTGNTLYYFQTILTNGILPNQLSAVSAAIVTSDVAETNPPFPVIIQATQLTLRFTFPATAFVPAASTSGVIFWGTSQVLGNTLPAVYLGIISGQPTWEASLFGLTPGRTYFFKSKYANFPQSTLVSQVTDLGNSFDLGYMPTKPWATPNPVVVRGVSLPWRQT